MSVPASLFIQPIVQRTSSISSPKTKVLDAQDNFCTIDSILVGNIMNFPILVSVYVSTGNFLIIPPIQIQPKSILQVLKESYFSLNSGEILYAISDSAQNFFNINIEGRLFKEVP